MARKYYAVYQSGYGILGVGQDLLGAVEQANSDLNAEDRIDYNQIERGNREEVDGKVYYRFCTQELFDAVNSRGGNIEYSVIDFEGHKALDLSAV